MHPKELMKTRKFEIKMEWFKEIREGRNTHEFREVHFDREEEYVYYEAGGRTYKRQVHIPEELAEKRDFDIVPVKYDRLRFETGSRGGKRPYMVVEVLGATASIQTDEFGRPYYSPNEDNRKIWMIVVDYHLGKIFK